MNVEIRQVLAECLADMNLLLIESDPVVGEQTGDQ